MTCSQPGTPAGKVMAASSAGHSVPVLRHYFSLSVLRHLVFRSHVIQSFGPTSFGLSVLRHLVFRSYVIQSSGTTS